MLLPSLIYSNEPQMESSCSHLGFHTKCHVGSCQSFTSLLNSSCFFFFFFWEGGGSRNHTRIDDVKLKTSQSHRGQKEPQEIIEFSPSAKAGTLWQVTQVGIQPGLEYLHRRRLYNLSGQPVTVQVLLHVTRNLLCSSFRPLLLVLPLHRRRDWPQPFASLWIFININQIPSQPSFHQLNRPKLLSLSSYRRCSRPFIIFAACQWTPSEISVFFEQWNPELDRK